MLSAPYNHLLNCRRDIKELLRDISNEQQLVLDFFEKSFRLGHRKRYCHAKFGIFR